MNAVNAVNAGKALKDPGRLRRIDILLLCTGNQCRSPMAQVLLQHHLDAAGIPARVHSAGELRGGVPASGGSVRAMAARGLDLSGHRSRTMGVDHLRGADLVIGMARRHVREAVLACPEIWGRAFTLKELVRRSEAVGPRGAGQPMAAWLDRLGSGRGPSDLLGDAATDDVDDPIGGPDHIYERTAAELDALIRRFVELAFGNAGPGTSTAAASSPTVTQEG